MKVEFKKNDKEYKMFTAFWILCQKYWEPEEDPDYWTKLEEDTIAFNKDFKDIRLSSFLGVALWNYLENKIKK